MNISIFYASEDYNELVDVQTYLKGASDPSDDVWSDVKIEPWNDWPEAIAERLLNTNVAIFLISKSFFRSGFLQHVEHPTAKVRERLDLLAARVPILIEALTDDDFKDNQWMKQMRFKNVGGQLVPFGVLKNEEKHLKLKEELDAARAKIRIGPREKECGDIEHLDLGGEVGQNRAAEKLANDYSECPDTCLLNAVKGYLKLRKHLSGAELAPRWGALVSQKLSEHRAMTVAHKAIFELLRRGLPESPVHLENFAPGDPNLKLILKPRVAPLLNGLKILESDYVAAEDLLIREPQHATCALAQCALGQCYRKKNKFLEAQHHLEEAGRLAKVMKAHCSCGLDCPRNSILAEVHRGLGTVHRKLWHLDLAKQEFELAIDACRGHGIPPKQKSGVHYSFGYFQMEHGVSCWDGGQGRAEKIQEIMNNGFMPTGEPSGTAETLLRNALSLFDDADHLNPGSGPARARKAIVRRLLNLPDADRDFIGGAKNAGSGAEGKLTKFFCKVGTFLMELESGRKPHDADMRQAATDLLDVFLSDNEVAEGPRQCHALDLQLVMRGTELTTLHPDLARIGGLLIESAVWPSLTGIEDKRVHIDEQHRRTREFISRWDQQANKTND